MKTPARQSTSNDNELPDNENNKSSNKMKIVFKSTKRSRSKSKKDKSKYNLFLNIYYLLIQFAVIFLSCQ